MNEANTYRPPQGGVAQCRRCRARAASRHYYNVRQARETRIGKEVWEA